MGPHPVTRRRRNPSRRAGTHLDATSPSRRSDPRIGCREVGPQSPLHVTSPSNAYAPEPTRVPVSTRPNDATPIPHKPRKRAAHQSPVDQEHPHVHRQPHLRRKSLRRQQVAGHILQIVAPLESRRRHRPAYATGGPIPGRGAVTRLRKGNTPLSASQGTEAMPARTTAAFATNRAGRFPRDAMRVASPNMPQRPVLGRRPAHHRSEVPYW